MKNETKNKHLTSLDRIDIEECLAKNMSFKDIAKRLGKSATTISREVKRHSYSRANSFSVKDGICPLLLKAPFVCNGCAKRSRSNCQYTRQLYLAKRAQSEYETLLVEARNGIPLNKQSFYDTEKIISTAVRNGQHIYHAVQTHKLPVSVTTVYRHIKKGYYTISPIDLPRAVKFKPRHTKEALFVPSWAKKGRTYEDYLAFTADRPDVPVIQFDTVIGRVGGKVIMTIHFVSCDFMIGILLENKTAPEAAEKISVFKRTLKDNGFGFGNIIPVILTDNGGEFSNVSAFENDDNGNPETHMFFCDSNSSYEKPHIEKNHTMFRDIVPKGASFDDFTQDTVNLIFSHVNAVKRKQFNGKSAYELFTFAFSENLANILGISFIPAENVIQTPALLH